MWGRCTRVWRSDCTGPFRDTQAQTHLDFQICLHTHFSEVNEKVHWQTEGNSAPSAPPARRQSPETARESEWPPAPVRPLCVLPGPGDGVDSPEPGVWCTHLRAAPRPSALRLVCWIFFSRLILFPRSVPVEGPGTWRISCRHLQDGSLAWFWDSAKCKIPLSPPYL